MVILVLVDDSLCTASLVGLYWHVTPFPDSIFSTDVMTFPKVGARF
jgi:hypothetical protein